MMTDFFDFVRDHQLEHRKGGDSPWADKSKRASFVGSHITLILVNKKLDCNFKGRELQKSKNSKDFSLRSE
jgi:hypothetical protein